MAPKGRLSCCTHSSICKDRTDPWRIYASARTHAFAYIMTWELISWEVDLVGVDHVGVDLVGVDLVGVDLVGGHQYIYMLSVRTFNQFTPLAHV